MDSDLFASGVFDFTDELKSFREVVSSLLTDHCDRAALHQYIDGKNDLAVGLWRKAAELGWLGAGLPEERGGAGMGLPGLIVLHRELGRHAAPGPFIATLSATQWISEFAGKTVRKTFLPQVLNGRMTVAIPASSSDHRVRLLRGKLHGVTRVLGRHDAQLALVPVRTDSEAAWALVKCSGEALRSESLESWDRTREMSDLTFDGAEPEELVADPTGVVAHRLFQHLSLGVAADSLGAAGSIAQKTVDYLNSRIQFDRPLGSFQALKHRAADFAIRLASSEHLLAHAAKTAEQQLPDAELWVRLAKASAAETFSFVAGDCVQLHGGVGHTWEFDCHIYLKRARLNEVIDSNASCQRDGAAKAFARLVQAQQELTELAI